MNGAISIVIGTKGGTGATTICVDVANALARNSNVAVVDADFAARRSVAVLTDMVRPLDVGRTSANMAIASKNKLTIIEMAASIDGAFTISQKDVEAIALNLIETCAAIVIDAPQPFAAAIRPFVVRAARFVLVVEPTLLGLTNARLVQIELERFGPLEDAGVFDRTQREPQGGVEVGQREDLRLSRRDGECRGIDVHVGRRRRRDKCGSRCFLRRTHGEHGFVGQDRRDGADGAVDAAGGGDGENVDVIARLDQVGDTLDAIERDAHRAVTGRDVHRQAAQTESADL